MRSNEERIKTNRVTVDKQLRAALNINTVKRGEENADVSLCRTRHSSELPLLEKALPLSDLTVISTVYLCCGFCGCHGYTVNPPAAS